jgi:hypothetical protein
MPELIENDSMWVASDTDLVRNTKHVERAHDTYLEGATGTDVQDDQDARVALVDDAHDVVENADLGADLNSADNAAGVPSYTGGNIVKAAANRAGVDLSPEDTSAVEDLEFEVLVAAAIQDGSLFAKGGQIPPTNYESEDGDDSASLSPYVDGMWLAEASKLTGEKFF